MMEGEIKSMFEDEKDDGEDNSIDSYGKTCYLEIRRLKDAMANPPRNAVTTAGDLIRYFLSEEERIALV
uniref:Uncharacterized protein n=1 Tax=Romanomermis culicivorax TaxID=13658 RepID=A0A915KPB1_ROMCU